MEVEKSVASGSTEYEIASVAPLRRGQDSPLSEAGFVDPVTIVVTGTVAMIAVRLVNHWLKKDERGLQIDLRTRPVTISQLRNVPAGVLVIIDKDGKPLVERQTYDKPEDVLPMLTRIFASEKAAAP